MKRTLAGCTLGFGLLLAAPAGAESLQEALSGVEAALTQLREEPRGCEDLVDRDLRRLRRDLEDAQTRPRRRDLERALEDTRDLAERSDRVCGRGFRKQLKRVERRLKRAARELEGASPRPAEAARRPEPTRRPEPVVTPPPEPAVVAITVDCWDASDPGCRYMKGGRHPMGKAAWQGLLQSVKASQPNVFQMTDLVKAAVANQALTSKQLITLVEIFKPSVFQMLDVVRVCAPNVVDPQNGLGIAAVFQPHVFQGKDAVKLMASQAPGKKLDQVIYE